MATALYLTAPLVEWYFYTTELARGSFPPDADSIAIPLFRFIIVWVLGAPVAALLIWFALRDYPGAVSLFAFNRARSLWSAAWTLVFGYLIVHEIAFAIVSVQKSQPFDVVRSLLLAYLMLCLRSSLIYSNFFSKEETVSLPKQA
ncbi:MAG TPA: hypothetical protein VK308_07555 [Pyrinomonadaceae bacterium]|nr:hypothetical protein [Pyrinomonadaceae bacterium]